MDGLGMGKGRYMLRGAVALLFAVWLLAGGGIATAAWEAIDSSATPEEEYVTPEKQTVYLTFDDGPSKLTGQVLDILQREGIKASFFVLGQYVEGRKELITRMKEEGHAVGNHSFSHVYKELYSDFAVFWDEAVRTDKLLEEALGYKPYLLRAPGGTSGNFDAFYFSCLEKAGYHIVDWNVDSGDASRKGVPAEEIIARVRQSALKHEVVVLLHDGAGHEETVKALPDIIEYYKEAGYSFAAIGESVKPVQFPLAKTRWERSYTPEAYEKAAADTAAAAAGRGEEVSSAVGQDEERAPSPDIPEEPASSLAIAVDAAAPWLLQPGQYGFEYGRFSVPLRQLGERLGGQVLWNDAERLATVRLGSLTVEVDPVRGMIREYRIGHAPVIRYLADVTWVNGEIRIPLRAMSGLLGAGISGYSLGDHPEVQVSFRGRQQVALLQNPLDNWGNAAVSYSHV